MYSHHLRFRYFLPSALSSLLLLAVGVVMSVLLLREQSRNAEALGENLSSRRAAADLEESLSDLSALLKDRVEGVSALHERIENHLVAVQRFADKHEERALVAKLIGSYRRYTALWQRAHEGPTAEHTRRLRQAIALLEAETLPRCEALRQYNTRQLELSEQESRRSLQWMAWGMGTVGITGAVAGLLLGYGVARGLRRSIHRLQIHLRDAAGKLGHESPALVLTEEGDLNEVQDRMQGLVRQIEQVVQKLQQRDREVRRAEQLAAVGQLAAGVAHEIRNPLTSIKMLVQNGREEAQARGVPLEDFEVIEHEIRRMERSLRVFLDFARLPRPERSPQDLAVLVGRTLDLIRGRAAKQGVRLRFEPPRRPQVVEADGEQIQQVLVNLTLNALDAMPGGGTLEVVLRPYGPDQVEVSVLDTGPGIAPSVMPRLFEPFVSTRETGLGLGLVISRRILDEHGGQLTAANRPEGGARFSLWLPARAAPAG